MQGTHGLSDTPVLGQIELFISGASAYKYMEDTLLSTQRVEARVLELGAVQWWWLADGIADVPAQMYRCR